MSPATRSPARPIPFIHSLATSHPTMPATASPTSLPSPTSASPTSPSRPSRFIEETMMAHSFRSRLSHQHSSMESSSSLSTEGDYAIGDLGSDEITPPMLREILLEMDEFEKRRRSRSGSGSASERASAEEATATTSMSALADPTHGIAAAANPSAAREVYGAKPRRDSDSSGRKVTARLRGRLRALTVGKS